MGPAHAGLPKLLDSVLHGWLGARGSPTSAGRSWASAQCNQFKESAIKSSVQSREVRYREKERGARVCKSQSRKMIVCGVLKALARRHRKYFIFDLLERCVCGSGVCAGVCVVPLCGVLCALRCVSVGVMWVPADAKWLER